MSSSVGASVLRACGLEARDEYFLHKPFDATAIEAAVDTSDVVLALLTPASYRSEICRAEQLRSLRKGKCLIPLLAVAGSDVPLHLEPKNYRDFTTEDTYAAGFQDLLRDVAELNGPR